MNVPVNSIRWPVVIFVCPEQSCDAWHPDTANGFPLHSSCEHQGHPPAVPVEVAPARF